MSRSAPVLQRPSGPLPRSASPPNLDLYTAMPGWFSKAWRSPYKQFSKLGSLFGCFVIRVPYYIEDPKTHISPMVTTCPGSRKGVVSAPMPKLPPGKQSPGLDLTRSRSLSMVSQTRSSSWGAGSS